MLKFIVNAAASAGLKPMLNGIPEVRKIGEVKDIKLKDGNANATVLLKGESLPISVTFDYAICGQTLRVTNVKTNKPWLDGMAEIFKDKYSTVDLGRFGKVADVVKLFV